MRLLVAIASYGTAKNHYLKQLVTEYRSMSFDVDIIVLSNVCKVVAPRVETLVVDVKGKDPWSLPFAHKKVFAKCVNDYDLFIYSEDDILVREENIQAFMNVSAALPETELPGFLRFERRPDGSLNCPDVHGRFHWDVGSVRSRGEYTLARFTNEHAACYALTRQQLHRAIDSGGFLVGPHSGKYDMLATAATDPYTQCGFQKVICISHLENFLVHHLPNNYVGTRFGVSDSELRRQVNALLRICENGSRPVSLLDTETNLPNGWYSKDYYEEVQLYAVSAIPPETRTVLSIGCGWGATEAYLAARGLCVTAVPLDPVIPFGAECKGVEIVTGNLDEVLLKLAGYKFDAVFLSNLLHLSPNPVEFLSRCAALLSLGGVCVSVVPNTARAATVWKALLWPGRVNGLATVREVTLKRHGSPALERYKRAGFHLTSQRTVRGWLQDAGMRVESLTRVIHPLQQKFSRFTLGLLDPWLASEFVTVAKRISTVSNGRATSREPSNVTV